MNQIKVLHNSFSKIHSIIFNLARENRINSHKLESYNRFAAQAFESLKEIEKLIQNNLLTTEGLFLREKKLNEKAKKYQLLLLMLGLKAEGIEILTNLPLRFLNTFYQIQIKHEQSISLENHFEMIMQKFRWLKRQIEIDVGNIRAMELFEKLSLSENQKAKKMATEILNNTEMECSYLIDEIRTGATEEIIINKIENYRYEQLSTHYPFQ